MIEIKKKLDLILIALGSGILTLGINVYISIGDEDFLYKEWLNPVLSFVLFIVLYLSPAFVCREFIFSSFQLNTRTPSMM